MNIIRLPSDIRTKHTKLRGFSEYSGHGSCKTKEQRKLQKKLERRYTTKGSLHLISPGFCVPMRKIKLCPFFRLRQTKNEVMSQTKSHPLGGNDISD